MATNSNYRFGITACQSHCGSFILCLVILHSESITSTLPPLTDKAIDADNTIGGLLDYCEDDDNIDADQFYLDYLYFQEIEIVFKFLETYRRKNGIKEIYMPIPNYDNYEVSNYGNVREKTQ